MNKINLLFFLSFICESVKANFFWWCGRWLRDDGEWLEGLGLPRGFFHNSASKQAARGQPTKCPNLFYRMSWIPKGSPVFLQDTAECKRMDFEGDERLREDGWWIKLAKGVPKTPTNLKTRVGRWMDFLNKLGDVLLWNDKIGEGFSGRKWWPWMDIVGMRLLIMKSLCTSKTLALHQPLTFIQKSCE